MTDIQSTKLVAFLHAVDEKGFKDLGKWLESPWCNSQKKLAELHKILLPAHKKSGYSRLTKQKIFERLNPDKPYNGKVLSNLFNDFIRKAEQWLAYRQFREEEAMQSFFLKEAHLQRKDQARFREVALDLVEKLEAKAVKSWKDRLILCLLYEQLHFEPGGANRYDIDKPFLVNADYYLDSFYAITKNRYLLESKFRDLILSKNLLQTPEFRQIRYLNNKMEETAFSLYSSYLSRPKKVTREIILEFCKAFRKGVDGLPEREQMIFLFACLNDAVRWSTKGDMEALQTMVALFKFGLEKGLLLDQGTLSGATYNNMVLAACIAGDLPFAETCLNVYTVRLPEEIRQEAETWAQAQVMHAKGQYAECSSLLEKSSFKDAIYAIQAKVTLIKAYGDLSIANPLQARLLKSRAIAFEQHMRRSKLYNEDKKEAFIRLIQYARRLIKTPEEGPLRPAQIDKIEKELRKEQNMFGKWWLFQVISRLRNI